MENAQWINKNQTIVAALFALCGALLALIGVIGGYLLNAYLNRRQQDRIRHQDATSLAAILAAEIHSLGNQARMLRGIFDELQKRIEDAEKNDDTDIDKNKEWEEFFLSYSGPRQFEKVGDKIGLLGPKLAFGVSGFYFLFFDVFAGIDSLSSGKLTTSKLKGILPALGDGLELVWNSRTKVLPDLLKFAHSKKSQSLSPNWLEDGDNGG